MLGLIGGRRTETLRWQMDGKDENTELFGHVIMLGFTGKEAVRQWADPTIRERQEQVSFEFYTWMNLIS